MTTPATNITKASVLAQMQTTIRDVVNGLTKWTALSPNNFGTDTGIPYGSYTIESKNYTTIPLQGDATQIVTTKPTTSDLPENVPVATTIETAFFSAAVALSAVRQIRLIKYYRVNDSGPIQFYDSGVIYGNLNTTYQQVLTDYSTPLAGALTTPNANASAAKIDALVSSIDALLTAHRNTTVNFTENWCHSSCHSSCVARCRR